MKPVWIAAFAVVVLFIVGCEDKQARYENQQLKDRLAKLEDSGGGSKNSDLLTLLAANSSKQDGETLDKLVRQLTTLSDDVRAGTADLKRQAKQNDEDASERIDDLEKRLRKVDELAITIFALKNMIETLEGKVEGLDPAEMLQLQRDLLISEAELKAARDARANAEAKVTEAKAQVTAAEADVELLNEEIAGLQGENISKHPMYKAIKKDLNLAKSKRREADTNYDNLKIKFDRLVDQIRKGGGGGEVPRPGDPKPTKTKYDFTGKVTSVKSGRRPGDPNIVLVSVVKGTVPGEGTELIALDEKNITICRIRITRLWHKDDDTSLAVIVVGGVTIAERPNKPLAKGDKVVWVKGGGGG